MPSDAYSLESIDSDIKFFSHLKNICVDLKIDNICDKLIEEIKKFKKIEIMEKKMF